MVTPAAPPIKQPSPWMARFPAWVLALAAAAALIALLGLARQLGGFPLVPVLYYNTRIVLLGTVLLGASAGLVGTFAVLRRQALVGDALAHAALPGLAAAFLLVGQRALPALLTGALVTGLLSVAAIAYLRRATRIKEDAAIGIALSVPFGLGIVLTRIIQNTTTTGSKAGLDTYILGKTAGMTASDVYLIAGLALACLVVVVLAYKEFKLVAFDAGFARAEGWPTVALDLALMGLVAVAVVVGLPAVGVVLMAALLILPAAAARFWTDRLGRMLVLAAFFGAIIGAVGTAASATYAGMPAGPIIVLVGTVVFLLSVLFAPRRGALARLTVQAGFRRRLQEKRMLLALDELSGKGARHEVDVDAILPFRSWRRPEVLRLLGRLVGQGLVEPRRPERFALTAAGAARAAEIARTHRLYQWMLAEDPDATRALVELDDTELVEQLPRELLEAWQAREEAGAQGTDEPHSGRPAGEGHR